MIANSNNPAHPKIRKIMVQTTAPANAGAVYCIPGYPSLQSKLGIVVSSQRTNTTRQPQKSESSVPKMLMTKSQDGLWRVFIMPKIPVGTPISAHTGTMSIYATKADLRSDGANHIISEYENGKIPAATDTIAHTDHARVGAVSIGFDELAGSIQRFLSPPAHMRRRYALHIIRIHYTDKNRPG